MSKDSNSPDLRVVSQTANLREEDIDSAVATVESGGQTKGNLKLRTDLLTEDGPPGQIRVKTPESTTWFSIYKMEWRIAKVLDGTRSLAEVARDMARLGVASDAKLVRSFARELKGYGFLQEGTFDAPVVDKPAEPENVSIEAQQFLNTANALQAKGDLQGACNYLLAFLEIEPTNHSVRDHLRQLNREMAEVEVIDNRRPSQTLDDDFSLRRPTMEAEPSSLRRPTMEEDRRRPTVMDAGLYTRTNEIPRPTLTEPTVVVAAPSSSRLPLIAGIAIGGALFSVAVVVGPSFLESSSKQPNVTPTPTTPPPVVAPPAVSDTAIAIQLEAAAQPAAVAPTAGVISKLLVKSGDAVRSGQDLAEIVDAESHEKIQKLVESLERLKKKGRRDPVVRHFKKETERKFAVAQRKAQRQMVQSSRAGVLNLAVKKGDAIAAGAVLASVGEGLVGKAPASMLPSGYERKRCEARLPKGKQTFACSLAPTSGSTGETVQISIGNGDGSLSAGRWVEVSFLEP